MYRSFSKKELDEGAGAMTQWVKYVPCQHEFLSLDSYHSCQNWTQWHVSVTSKRMKWDRQMPVVFWLASLNEWVSESMREPLSKKGVEKDWRRYPTSTSGLHVCMHGCYNIFTRHTERNQKWQQNVCDHWVMPSWSRFESTCRSP